MVAQSGWVSSSFVIKYKFYNLISNSMSMKYNIHRPFTRCRNRSHSGCRTRKYILFKSLWSHGPDELASIKCNTRRLKTAIADAKIKTYIQHNIFTWSNDLNSRRWPLSQYFEVYCFQDMTDESLKRFSMAGSSSYINNNSDATACFFKNETQCDSTYYMNRTSILYV